MLPLMTAAAFGAAALLEDEHDAKHKPTIAVVDAYGNIVGEVQTDDESVGAVSRSMGGRGPTAGWGLMAHGVGGGSRIAKVLSEQQLQELGFSFEPEVAFGRLGFARRGPRGGKIGRFARRARHMARRTGRGGRQMAQRGRQAMQQGQGSGQRPSRQQVVQSLKRRLREAQEQGDWQTAEQIEQELARIFGRASGRGRR